MLDEKYCIKFEVKTEKGKITNCPGFYFCFSEIVL